MKKMKLFWPIFAVALLITWPTGDAAAGHREPSNAHMEIPDEVGDYLHAINEAHPDLKLEHKGFCPGQRWQVTCTLSVRWYDNTTGENFAEAIFVFQENGRIGPLIKFTWPDDTEWHK